MADDRQDSYGTFVSDASGSIAIPNGMLPTKSMKKWLMLIILSVLTAINQAVCFSYAPIAEIAETRWDNKIHSTWLITIFFVAYIPCSFLGSWIMDSKGLRYGILIGGLFQALGANLRAISCLCSPSTEVILTVVGQIFAATASPFMLNSPPMLSANWFPPSLRATATSIAVNANSLGTAITYMVAPILVHDVHDLPMWNAYVAICSTAFFLIAISCFQSFPKVFPAAKRSRSFYSLVSSAQDDYDWKQWLAAFSHPGFTTTVIVFSIAECIMNAMATLMGKILRADGFAKSELGIIGAAFIITMSIGGQVISSFVDKHQNHKQALMVSALCSSISLACFSLSCSYLTGISTFLLLMLVGLCIGPQQPVALELGVECAYPTSEATVAALQQLCGNVLSAVMVPTLGALRRMYTDSSGHVPLKNFYADPQWIQVFMLLSTFAIISIYNGKYKRLENEKTQLITSMDIYRSPEIVPRHEDGNEQKLRPHVTGEDLPTTVESIHFLAELMAGKTDGLRKRTSANGSKSNGEKQNTKELERTKSWSEKATDHVTSRRRYSILFGALLGVVGVFMTQIHYFDDNFPDFLDHQTIQQLRHQWNFDNWSTNIRDEFFDAIDYRPSSAPEDGVRPGVKLRGEGLGAHSPVILLPGFSSTGLEIWNGSECVQTYFRQRIWGTSRMVQQFLMNQRCWLEHLMLNRTTGMDPDGIKLRPAEGLEAADYVIGGYWVWAKLIENLADIGYDSNSMYMAAYDWRMAPAQMEERDQYFTKLRYTIEMARASSGGKKVMIVAHSYALQVFYYFMQWVQSPKGGNMGSSWMDENVESFANIAGPTLGTIKSISTLMSGEMKDTAELGGLSKVLGFFFGPKSRALLARSWPSVYAMLPVGGDTIWGDEEYAADDLVARFAVPAEGTSATYNKSQIPEHVHRHGSNGKVVQFTNNTHANFTAGNVHGFLGSVDKNLEHFRQNFSVGIADDPSDDKYDDSKYWVNPLETRLPYAPQMKIFCLYGVGKPVERGYIYRENPGEDDVVGDKDVVPYVMDLDYTDAPWIKAGVRYSDGDGTVPLISLGYMCSHGWRSKRYNPSGMEVRSREYVHDPLPMMFDPRGGPATSDHVDIMGNHNLISDLLRIAAREYDAVPERVTSEIHELVKRVPLELD